MSEVAVVAISTDEGVTIDACYATSSTEPLSVIALKKFSSENLPGYMVPAAYVRLDALPLTPNGKLDRKALPSPDGDSFARRGYEAPAGEAEELVASIWSDLLGVERVGRHDDFFELGGHSLLAVRLVSRLREALDLEVPIRDLFARSRLSEFASGLSEVPGLH